MLCHKRDDVGDKCILISRLDRIAENVICSRFSREAPATERQDLLEARQLQEQLPLKVVGFEVADTDVLCWRIADDDFSSAVGDAAVFVRG
jgi:hypothetical protein